MARRKQSLILYGGGGHGRVVGEAAEAAGWRVVGVIDDGPLTPGSPGSPGSPSSPGSPPGLLWPRLTGAAAAKPHAVIVAIGDNRTRRAIALRLLAAGRRLATVIHPTACISLSATIGRGVYVGAHCVINCRAVIGDGAIINTAAVVEHDCAIGPFAHVAPGSVLTGYVTVGELALVGAGSRVIPGVAIGPRATIGAGAAVVRDVPAGKTVKGVPAR